MAQNADGTLTPAPESAADALRRIAGRRSDAKVAAMQALMLKMLQPDPQRERAMSLVATVNALRGPRGNPR
jgi:hypothetical protein